MPDAKYCPQTARELLRELVAAMDFYYGEHFIAPDSRSARAFDAARAYLAAQAEPREPPCAACGTYDSKTCSDAYHVFPPEPRTLLEKMRRVHDAVVDLEGEEIVYGDAIILANAGRIAREFIKANEVCDD